MGNNNEIKSELRPVLLRAIEELSGNYKGSSLTDIFIIIDMESSEIAVYDDEENCIVREIIRSWAEKYDVFEKDVCESCYAHDLREVIAELDSEGAFSVLDVYTPFSINLADENFFVLEELLSIEDDSIIKLENEFMAKMDKEFDEFLDRLMKE